MRIVAAGPDGLATTTVQRPARWAGRNGNLSKQTSSERRSWHALASWEELRMLGRMAPYQVRMLTPTSTETGAVTVTSNGYRAGSGAVIPYWTEDRPTDIDRLAACGCSTTPAGLAVLPTGCPVAPLLVHAAAESANSTPTASPGRPRLMPPP